MAGHVDVEIHPSLELYYSYFRKRSPTSLRFYIIMVFTDIENIKMLCMQQIVASKDFMITTVELQCTLRSFVRIILHSLRRDESVRRRLCSYSVS